MALLLGADDQHAGASDGGRDELPAALLHQLQAMIVHSSSSSSSWSSSCLQLNRRFQVSTMVSSWACGLVRPLKRHRPPPPPPQWARAQQQ
jgi:hypothetical protein